MPTPNKIKKNSGWRLLCDARISSYWKIFARAKPFSSLYCKQKKILNLIISFYSKSFSSSPISSLFHNKLSKNAYKISRHFVVALWDLWRRIFIWIIGTRLLLLFIILMICLVFASIAENHEVFLVIVHDCEGIRGFEAFLKNWRNLKKLKEI